MRNLSRSQRSTLANHSSANSPEKKQVDLKYHRLRCEICRHALCQQIEEAFLQWRSPKTIMHCFRVKTETSIYHHAHAFGLFDLRDQNLRLALGNIIEDADTLPITAQDVLRAVYSLAHINDQGKWVHPTNKSEVVVSANRTSATPSGRFAGEADASCIEQPCLTSAARTNRQPDPAHVLSSSLATRHPSLPESIASETKSKTDVSP